MPAVATARSNPVSATSPRSLSKALAEWVQLGLGVKPLRVEVECNVVVADGCVGVILA